MSQYETSNVIKKYTELGDIKALRSALATMIYTDRNFAKGYFDNSIEYIRNHIDPSKKEKIYEKFNPTIPMILDSKKNNFTEDDFVDAICNLKKNFCQERRIEVETIGKVLYCDCKINEVGKIEENKKVILDKLDDLRNMCNDNQYGKLIIGSIVLVGAVGASVIVNYIMKLINNK